VKEEVNGVEKGRGREGMKGERRISGRKKKKS